MALQRHFALVACVLFAFQVDILLANDFCGEKNLVVQNDICDSTWATPNLIIHVDNPYPPIEDVENGVVLRTTKLKDPFILARIENAGVFFHDAGDSIRVAVSTDNSTAEKYYGSECDASSVMQPMMSLLLGLTGILFFSNANDIAISSSPKKSFFAFAVLVSVLAFGTGQTSNCGDPLGYISVFVPEDTIVHDITYDEQSSSTTIELTLATATDSTGFGQLDKGDATCNVPEIKPSPDLSRSFTLSSVQVTALSETDVKLKGVNVSTFFQQERTERCAGKNNAEKKECNGASVTWDTVSDTRSQVPFRPGSWLQARPTGLDNEADPDEDSDTNYDTINVDVFAMQDSTSQILERLSQFSNNLKKGNSGVRGRDQEPTFDNVTLQDSYTILDNADNAATACFEFVLKAGSITLGINGQNLTLDNSDLVQYEAQLIGTVNVTITLKEDPIKGADYPISGKIYLLTTTKSFANLLIEGGDLDVNLPSFPCCDTKVSRRRRGITGPPVPEDSRSSVSESDIELFPYETIMCISYKNPDGSAPASPDCTCTGTLISRRHVLTAGHCIHEGPGGDWLDIYRLYAHPYNGDAIDDRTSYKYNWKTSYTVTGWAWDGHMEWDYALIELKKDSGNKFPGNRYSWMAFGYDDDISTSYNWNLNGYPVDKATSRSVPWLWHGDGGTYDVEDMLVLHEVDTRDGQSGSALYLYQASEDSRIINAIHRGMSTDVADTPTDTVYNIATRIDANRYAEICGWINLNPASSVC